MLMVFSVAWICSWEYMIVPDCGIYYSNVWKPSTKGKASRIHSFRHSLVIEAARSRVNQDRTRRMIKEI